MHLLVTRPETETRVLRERLEATGHTVTVEPLLEVELLAPPTLLTSPQEGGGGSRVQALLVTSKNGVRALQTMPGVEALQAIPLFAVGPGTAAAARDAGFTRVTAGPSSARELAPIVAAACDPAAGPLLYLTGETVAYDLDGDLGARGFEIRRVVVYRSRPRDSLTPTTRAALKSGAVDGVLLMSPSTADAYAALVASHGLSHATVNVVHFCISANVAARLAPLEPIRTAISVQPNMEEMLALVATVAAQLQARP